MKTLDLNEHFCPNWEKYIEKIIVTPMRVPTKESFRKSNIITKHGYNGYAYKTFKNEPDFEERIFLRIMIKGGGSKNYILKDSCCKHIEFNKPIKMDKFNIIEYKNGNKRAIIFNYVSRS